MNTILDKIIGHLNQVAALQNYVDEQGLAEQIERLQQWQCRRLLVSHDDLWQQKRFKPAMQFFIDELYGPKDFSQRDKDIARVVPKMANILPEKALASLESALHLNALSYQLDIEITQQLAGAKLDRNSYAGAYKACDNLAERALQIEYIAALGSDLADVIDIRGISALLMLSRKPAKLAGVLSLHEFLEAGYKAFKKLGNVSDFIEPIVNREKDLMNSLFSNTDTNPLPEDL